MCLRHSSCPILEHPTTTNMKINSQARQVARLSKKLAATQMEEKNLSINVQKEEIIEQVSIDCILQLEEVIDFKSRMHVDGCVPPQSLRRCHPQQQQQHHHHPQQQQQQQQHHSQQQQGEGRYVTRLLDGVTREQVDAVVAWSAEDWSQQFESWCSQMPMLLDVISRALPTAPDQLTPAHVTVAQQRLEQAVDYYVTHATLGLIYKEVVGARFGPMAARNHITHTMDVAPSNEHWHHVVARVQLTTAQHLQLVAGYQTFVQLRRAHQAAQHSIVQLATCRNTCGVQTLAAAKEASRGALAGLAIGGAGEDEGDCSGSPAAAAGGAAPGEEEAALGLDPVALAHRLLAIPARSANAIQLLLYNTLTKHQLARMVIASYPYVPRAAPILEAAAAVLQPEAWLQHQQEQEAGALPGLTEQHMQQRCALLRRQCNVWWLDGPLQ